MTIANALANANSGLIASARRADVAAGNIANAMTPGYARREVSVSEQVLNGMGSGVVVNGVLRAQDAVLTRERRGAEAQAGREETLSGARVAIERAYGLPDDPASLFSQVERLESALRVLADTPESPAGQAQTLDAAKSLAQTFNRLSQTAQAARKDADADIGRTVEAVNAALKEIEQLNSAIGRGATNKADVTALEDRRKTLIDQVSAAIPVREVGRGDGRIDLVTDEGVFLIDGKARQLSFSPSATIAPESSYGDGLLSGLHVEGVEITPGGPAPFAVRQGALAGFFAVRDEVMPAFQAQIDALARDMIERFEGLDPTTDPEDPGLFTDAGAAFDPDEETGLAARIAVNAAVDPAQGGDLWRLRDGIGAAEEGPAGVAGLVHALLGAVRAERALPPGAGLAGAHSAADAAAAVSSSLGAARLSAETSLSGARARADAARDAESGVTGVDTDLEMQKLLMIERSYAANARVIQTVQAMILALMEI